MQRPYSKDSSYLKPHTPQSEAHIPVSDRKAEQRHEEGYPNIQQRGDHEPVHPYAFSLREDIQLAIRRNRQGQLVV